ncbi:hypothetical protein LZ016_10905 [Sphingomonas sp. SM33]|uniref:DUF2157 domain-containing protein n=1 Tax=Sphingomonas telluris TaxID=2907998 RepID=A0ABS9VNQ1_9SPHN|nr:hypothetical protein [Sphingomonas telluris]MCH8616605.1 hypothetical protein [Sphingomonas telluris]
MTYLTQSAGNPHPYRTDRQQVADVLMRYPSVSSREVEQVIRFLQTGRHLDIGLLTSDERIRRNLDHFMEDHKERFRVKWHEVATVTIMLILMLASLWLLGAALS